MENIRVDNNPNLRWCPKPGCIKFVEKEKGLFSTKGTCECGQEVCMRCGNPFHSGVRCANVGDQQLQQWIKENKNIKYCPKCAVRTEKTEGCDHMTCPRCQYEWCWRCRCKFYSYSHYDKWNIWGCPC